MSQETPVGKYPKPIMPQDISLSLNGAGKVDVRFFGKMVSQSPIENEAASLLTATLYELVRAEFPEVELLDAGPGLLSLKEKAESLTALLNQVQADCQAVAVERAELAQKLAEAEAANEALTEEMARRTVRNSELEARIAELEPLEAAAAKLAAGV